MEQPMKATAKPTNQLL